MYHGCQQMCTCEFCWWDWSIRSRLESGQFRFSTRERHDFTAIVFKCGRVPTTTGSRLSDAGFPSSIIVNQPSRLGHIALVFTTDGTVRSWKISYLVRQKDPRRLVQTLRRGYFTRAATGGTDVTYLVRSTFPIYKIIVAFTLCLVTPFQQHLTSGRGLAYVIFRTLCKCARVF